MKQSSSSNSSAASKKEACAKKKSSDTDPTSVWKLLSHPFRAIYSLVVFIFFYIASAKSTLALLSFVQTVTSYGYPCEAHQITTRDGYQLTAFRIPHGKKSLFKKEKRRDSAGEIQKEEKARPAVLLMHGLMDNSYTWIVNGPTYSLAYLLADAGYDVWLGNNRGNNYSKRHVYLSCWQRDFWQFSYDEFADYDLPDTIDFILKTTGQTQVHYIGHSEGTTQAFAGLSSNPTLAKKMKSFTGFGPVASVAHMTNGFMIDLARIRIDWIIELLGFDGSFNLPFHSDLIRTGIAGLLYVFPFLSNEIVRVLCGKPRDGADLSRKVMAGWAESEPGGTSVRNVAHWAQAARAGNHFLRYNYGKDGNMRRYGADHPPEYILKNISPSLPKYFWSGTVDELADPKDTIYLVSQLALAGLKAEENLQLTWMKGYNHMDFIWDIRAAKEIYPNLLKHLERLN